jgi:hypothetical protein
VLVQAANDADGDRANQKCIIEIDSRFISGPICEGDDDG